VPGYYVNGDLEAQPFALWRDITDYDDNEEATSGTVQFTISKLEPGTYTVGLAAPVLSNSAIA